MKIAILGYGIEGKSLIRYFLKKGADITLCDQREISLKDAGLPNVKKQCGEKYLEGLEKFDFVFRSPGIPFLTPAIQRAIQRGAKITSLTKYFFEKCPAKIIGITGTKGKGTTAMLLYDILKAYVGRNVASGNGRPRVFLGGNIGYSAIDFLDELKPNNLVILELSSFQLQDLEQSPGIAVVLPITEDHLDYHKTMEEYIEAKRNIIRYQKPKDTTIINVDETTGAKNFALSFLSNLKTKHIVKVSVKKPFMEIYAPHLLGEHNKGNVLAAAAAAKAVGVPDDIILDVAKGFLSLPHRLEFITEIQGVEFYNDSASTNPDTTIAALLSFTKPIILIVGGSEKFVSYERLGEKIVRQHNVKTVVLMGQTAKRIEEAIDHASEIVNREIRELQTKGKTLRLRTVPLEVIKSENYQEAFMAAKILAKSGDIVLLSPASASFDMFENYEERGNIFKAFVKNLGNP